MFVVENNEGLTDATAYISVADADIHFQSYGQDDTWGTLSITRKQQLLNSATRTIDATFSFIGERKNIKQILEFPRLFRTYSGSYYYGRRNLYSYAGRDLIRFEGEVPRPLKHATAQLAFRLSQEDRYTEFSTRDLGISTTRIGDISITNSANPIRTQSRKRAIPNYIAQIISDFIVDPSSGIGGP